MKIKFPCDGNRSQKKLRPAAIGQEKSTYDGSLRTLDAIRVHTATPSTRIKVD